jgi:hypothetical protein
MMLHLLAIDIVWHKGHQLPAFTNAQASYKFCRLVQVFAEFCRVICHPAEKSSEAVPDADILFLKMRIRPDEITAGTAATDIASKGGMKSNEKSYSNKNPFHIKMI